MPSGKTKFQTNCIRQMIWMRWIYLSWITDLMLHVACVNQSRREKDRDFIFFSSYTGKIFFFHQFQVHSYSTDPFWDCKNKHTPFKHTSWRGTLIFMAKTALTSDSDMKCYTLCKMFHLTLCWLIWLSKCSCHSSHPKHMNAWWLDTSSVILFSIDFSPLLQSVFTPS